MIAFLFWCFFRRNGNWEGYYLVSLHPISKSTYKIKAKHYRNVEYLIGRFWNEVQDDMPEAWWSMCSLRIKRGGWLEKFTKSKFWCRELSTALGSVAGRRAVRPTHSPVHAVVAACEFLISSSLLPICSRAEVKAEGKAEVWPAVQVDASAWSSLSLPWGAESQTRGWAGQFQTSDGYFLTQVNFSLDCAGRSFLYLCDFDNYADL